MKPAESVPTIDQLTSFHVERARGGSLESTEWLVRRFSSLLTTTARYHLRTLSRYYDPEDVANDVWAITLPRLAELRSRGGRFTPVVVKFLSTTVVRRCNDLIRRHKRERMLAAPPPDDSRDAAGLIDMLPAATTMAISRLVRKERGETVARALDELPPRDLEILVLRGVEQLSYKVISVLLGRDHKSLSVAYGRALKRLREKLPSSVFAELEDDEPTMSPR